MGKLHFGAAQTSGDAILKAQLSGEMLISYILDFYFLSITKHAGRAPV